MMPTWSSAPTAAQLEVASGPAERLRFREVLTSYSDSSRQLGRWAKGKTGELVGRVVPAPVKKVAVKVAARVAAKRD